MEKFKIVELEEQPALTIRAMINIRAISEFVVSVFEEIMAYCEEKNIRPVGPPFAIYHRAEMDFADVECGLPVESRAEGEGKIRSLILPGGKVATTIHVGPYDLLGATYAKMHKWMMKKGLEPGGTPWESYINNPAEIEDPSKLLTQIFWPLKETSD